MDVDQWHERHAAFVSDPRLNVVRIHLKEQPGRLCEWRRPPRIDPCAEPRGPCQPDQISVISIVIRVVVRQEDVAQRGQWHIGKNKLTSHAVAAVDAALFQITTWADAELAFRGRGPPPVPSRMSLVLIVWLWALFGCENAPTKVAVAARNARRRQAGICCPERNSTKV